MQNLKHNRIIKKVEEEGGDIRSIPAPQAVNEDYVQCEHCGRRFAPGKLPCLNIFRNC
jgi:hypothetical protein